MPEIVSVRVKELFELIVLRKKKKRNRKKSTAIARRNVLQVLSVIDNPHHKIVMKIAIIHFTGSFMPFPSNLNKTLHCIILRGHYWVHFAHRP